MKTAFSLLALSVALGATDLCPAQPTQAPTPGDERLAAYFAKETARLRDNCLAGIETREQWEAARPELRRQLLEMLGLDPLPERTELRPQVTGVVERDDWVVENLQFQSRPGLYVTANLYRPRQVDQPLPAILYVCGHGGVKVDGVSHGNKVTYQHHGEWFARNGYVCLTIDTLQLGEIEGIHHGTYNQGRWWWLNRGYTPAGVEAWNCVRALDYLETRPEVDPHRLGVTGRSGGGAYSWWIAAIDERIKAAVPVAGITDLQNHVVDGCVDGHCDCMYFVNTYGWDYPLVAALVAPRPLLISNTDRDSIFPLEGVVRTHAQARKIYRLYGADEDLALQIAAGPHKDTQELRVHAFRWFNQHLRHDDSLLRMPAEKLLTPPELKVFDELPTDEHNTRIDEEFVPAAAGVMPPESKTQWGEQSVAWRRRLLERSFAGWPAEWPTGPAELTSEVRAEGLRLRQFEFASQPEVQLTLWVAHREDLPTPQLVVLNVLDQQGWEELLGMFAPLLKSSAEPGVTGSAATGGESWNATRRLLLQQPWAMAYLAPRGVGPDAWGGDDKRLTQIRRRFYLLGQTVDGMRVWDVRRARETLRRIDGLEEVPLWLQAERQMSGVALHAALFDDYRRVDLYDLPTTYRDGPVLLNAQRFVDLPQVAALVAERSPLVLYRADPQAWTYVGQTAQALGWSDKQFQLR